MNRNYNIDFLKGIAIISVIVGHSISEITHMNLYFNLIYSFHMPLFIFISGYLEEKSEYKYMQTKMNFFLHKASCLLLPYCIWTILYELKNIRESGINIKEICTKLLGYNQGGLWFLAVLFGLNCMHILFWYFKKWFVENKERHWINKLLWEVLAYATLEIMIVIIAIITKNPLIINILSYSIPYFAAIFVVDFVPLQKLGTRPMLATGSIIIYLIGFQFFDFYNTSPITQVLRIGLSLCVIFVLFKIVNCMKTKKSNVLNIGYKGFCILGQNTMSIYLLHGFFLDYKPLLIAINSSLICLVLAIFLALIVSTICIGLNNIIKISPFLSKILFGKSIYH